MGDDPFVVGERVIGALRALTRVPALDRWAAPMALWQGLARDPSGRFAEQITGTEIEEEARPAERAPRQAGAGDARRAPDEPIRAAQHDAGYAAAVAATRPARSGAMTAARATSSRTPSPGAGPGHLGGPAATGAAPAGSTGNAPARIDAPAGRAAPSTRLASTSDRSRVGAPLRFEGGALVVADGQGRQAPAGTTTHGAVPAAPAPERHALRLVPEPGRLGALLRTQLDSASQQSRPTGSSTEWPVDVATQHDAPAFAAQAPITRSGELAPARPGSIVTAGGSASTPAPPVARPDEAVPASSPPPPGADIEQILDALADEMELGLLRLYGTTGR